MKIGFAGIGLMGLPLCQRLLQQGHELQIWNRSPAKCEPLRALGASIAATPAELAGHGDVILTCLADDNAMTAVCHGPNGLLSTLRADQILLDHSSISPALTRKLATLAKDRGAHWLDAPVSGGVRGAETGQLVIMAGGEAEPLARVQPLLAAYAQRVTHMGASGSGQVTKLCNQLIVAANSLLVAEAVALARRAGVDARQLAPALAGGFADSLPFQILAPRMATDAFEPVQWRVATLAKDLGNALALATGLSLETPVAASALARLQAHATAGHASADLSSVIQCYQPGETA